MDFRLFLENNTTYQIPSDKQQLMYDFYVLQMLYGKPHAKYQSLHDKGIIVSQPKSDFRDMDRDEKIDYKLEEVARILIPYLKQEFLDIVYFAIASELRHVHKKSKGDDNDMLNQFKISTSRKQLGDEGGDYIDDDPRPQRVNAYKKSKEITEHPEQFVLNARKAFSTREWNNAFGGEAWVLISNAWLNLSRAQSIPEMMVQIDHIYDIQHNTGSVFDKSDEYEINYGYNWIKRALDHKAKVNDPIEMIQYASPSMRRIALPAIKAKFGSTLESHDGYVAQEAKRLTVYAKRFNAVMQSPNRSIARALLFQPMSDSVDVNKFAIQIAKNMNVKIKIDILESFYEKEKENFQFWTDNIGTIREEWESMGGLPFRYLPRVSRDQDTVEEIIDSTVVGRHKVVENVTGYSLMAIRSMSKFFRTLQKDKEFRYATSSMTISRYES